LHSKQDINDVEEICGLKTVSSPSMDQFYTKPVTARSCAYDFVSRVSPQDNDLIIEPSAGNGSFIKPLNSVKCKKIFLDIAPESTNIKRVDFLS
jgi:hypothetical protein